jgi:hypothetical protein
MDGVCRASTTSLGARARGRRRLVALLLVMLLGLATIVPAAAAKSDADTLALLIGRARQHESVVGPLAGDLPLETDAVHLIAADVALRDFYARAAFGSPFAGADHVWDVGLAFRRTDRSEDFRLILDSDGNWYFKEGPNPPLATGRVSGLGTEVGAVTRIDLVARGDLAWFAVNGAYVATLDLSSRPMAGDVVVGSGFYSEDIVQGASTPYAEFEVWSLDAASDATATADDGVVTQSADEIIFDLVERGDSGISGVVDLTARGELTEVGVFAFNTDGTEPVELAAGTCDAPAAPSAFALNPVDPETLTGTTTVAAGFDELTDGGHVVAIRDSDDGSILACAEIPTP